MVEEMNWQLIVMEAGGGHWASMLHQITFANTEVSQLYYIYSINSIPGALKILE